MKAVLIVLLLVTGARAQELKHLNFEQWNVLSDEGQLRYLHGCIEEFLAGVHSKEDQAEAQMIRHYFSDKRPGQKFSEGTAKLLLGVGSLLEFHHLYPLVNLTSVDVCLIAAQVILDKSKEYEKSRPLPAKP